LIWFNKLKRISSNDNNKYNKNINLFCKKNSGFTLLEMIVVVGVFAILIVVSVEIFTTLYNVGQKTNVSRSLTQDLRYTLETISRESRDAYELNPYNENDLNFPNQIEVKAKNGHQLKFFCEDNSGNMCSEDNPGSLRVQIIDNKGNDLGNKKITSEKTKVTIFRVWFIESWGESNLNNLQPRFKITISGKSEQKDRGGNELVVTLQTAVSRTIYSDITYCDLFECEASLYVIVAASNNDTYRYDISEDRWFYVGNRQTASYSGTSLSDYNNKLYSPRGLGNDFWEFDVNTRKWTRKANAPFNFRIGSDSEGLSNKIYVNAGDNLPNFASYNILNDEWTSLANIPFARISSGFTLTSYNNNIYALQASGERGFAVYNTSSNTWSNLASLPDSTVNGCLAQYQNKFYAVSWTNRLRSYDISTNTWSAQISTVPSGMDSCEIINDKIYFKTSNASFISQFWLYDISNNTWERKADLPVTDAPTGMSKWLPY